MSIIGLDIGSSHIKAVSIQKENDLYQLKRYALLPAGNLAANFFSDSMDTAGQVASTLRGILDDGYFTETDAVVVIPEDKVFSKVISVPYLEGDELKKAVEWEAEQHLPNDLSDNYLKYTVLDSPGSDTSSDQNQSMDAESKNKKSHPEIIEILIVAAPKKLVDKTLAILSAAELSVSGIEPISISIIRSLIGSSNPTPTIIINLGQAKVDFYLSVNGNLRFVHNINFGISSIVKAVSKELDISPLQANEYVFTYGLKENELSGRIREIMLPVVDIIIEELKKSVRYVESRSQFTAHSPDKRVKRMILAGGGALIPDMMVHLIENLHPEIEFANPWWNVDMTGLKDRNVLMELGPIFAASIGAGMK